MVRWHLRSKKTATGAKLNRLSKKKKMQRGSKFLETKIHAKKTKMVRKRGGRTKANLLSVDFVNISDTKTGKTTKAKILSVQDNPANPHYVRRNIITKGAVLKTDAGAVRVTSRPGQNGTVSGVLLEKEEK
jgi:small subunit ribosomal protein S8e